MAANATPKRIPEATNSDPAPATKVPRLPTATDTANVTGTQAASLAARQALTASTRMPDATIAAKTAYRSMRVSEALVRVAIKPTSAT
jgi:hypothetical protein